MSIIESNADELRAKIADLRKKIKLSESKEEIMIMTDEIESLTNKLKNVNRKEPKVVPVKDAKTVGDKMESRLASRNSSTRMGNKSVLI